MHAVGTSPDTLQEAVEDVVQTADVLLGAPLDAAPTSASTSAPTDAGGLIQGCEMAVHTMLLQITPDTLVTPAAPPPLAVLQLAQETLLHQHARNETAT